MTICLCFTLSMAFGQSEFLKTGSIGTVDKPQAKNKKLYGPVDFRSLDEMIGEEFIIMPTQTLLQKYGYTDIYKNDATESLSYKDGVGVVLKFIRHEGYKAFFQDSLGNHYKIGIYMSCIKDVASLTDLKQTSKLFLHQRLWVRRSRLTTYDENTDEEGMVKDVKLEPVSVEGIAVSFNDMAPIRLILKTSLGQTGYIDVNVSGSNLLTDYRNKGTYLFNEAFWTFNPKTKYKYTPAMWALIKNEKVALGMTKKQVKLSVGNPDDINYSTYKSGNREQWIFGTKHRYYYYFTNGIFTSQN